MSMLIAQERNGELASLLTSDLLSADDRNVAISLYNGAGGGFTSVVTLTLGQTRLNLAPTLYAWDGSVLTLSEAGIYQVEFGATVVNSTGAAPAEAEVWLEQDPATGVFAAVPGAAVLIYVPDGAGRGNSAARSILVRARAGYRLRLRAQRTAGTDTPAFATNGATLDVMRLYKAG